MLRTTKERLVDDLAEQLRTSDTLLVADYRGLTHAELDDVRTELLKSGTRFAVVKNTLTKRAAEAAGVDGLNEFLTGPTAIAFVSGGDMVAVAKTLADTARQTRRLSLKGGILQGQTIGADDVRDLAMLPPADVLRGQLLGAIVGPVASIVGIFGAPLRDFVGVLDSRIRQLEEAGGSETPPPAEEPEAPQAVDLETPAVETTDDPAVETPQAEMPPEADAESAEEPTETSQEEPQEG